MRLERLAKALKSCTARRVARAGLRAAVAASTALLVGCYTAPLKQAEGIGASGKAYAQAVRAVAEFALSDVLDYEVDQLEVERDGYRSSAERVEYLKQENDLLRRRIQLVETAALQVSLVEEYFSALEALAGHDVRTPATAAVGSLLESLDALEATIDKAADERSKGGLRRLTPEERSAAAKLVGLVAQSVHARQVAERLADDAPTIGRHLRMLTLHMTALSGWVARRQENRQTTFFAMEIEAPFVDDRQSALPADWKEKYKRYLRGATINEKLKQAAETARAMELAWQRYLSGTQGPEDFEQNVKDMRQLVQAVAALKTARVAARESGGPQR
jgi:hypothetical protein